MTWTLKAPSPFSLASVIDSHGWIQLAPFIEKPELDGFDYTLRLADGRQNADPAHKGERVVDCRITPVEHGIHLHTDAPLSDTERRELQQIAAWMVGLELDLRPFYAHARQEPRLAHMEPAAKGRMLRSATVYEDLVKTILTTNTAWSGTRRMNEALVSLYGTPGPNGQNAFPTPAQLAALDPDELRTAAKVGYRAPYIVELSQAVETGRLNLEALKNADLPTDEVRKFLLAIKGVGDYAAASMLLLLGHYDFVPVDSMAVKSVGQMWHNGARVGPKEIYAAFEAWRPYRGLAYWFWQWD